MTPRTGRPPKPEDERRSETLRFRVTPAEKELLAAASDNFAEWARERLLAAAKRARRP